MQSQALATVKVLKRLEAGEVAALEEAAEREVLRPVLVGAVLELMNGDHPDSSVLVRISSGGTSRCFQAEKRNRGVLLELDTLENCPKL